MPHEIPSRPFERIACDLFVHNSYDYLLTVDYYSNFFEVDRLSNKRGPEVIHKLKKLISLFGIPDIVMSDNGPPFNGAEFRNFAIEYGFKHRTSSPRFPSSNGLAERCIATAKVLMTKVLESKSDQFLALLDYRNTKTQMFEESPAQRFLGHRTRSSLPIKSSLLTLPNREKNMSSMRAAKQVQAHYYNRSAHDKPELHRDDTVRVKVDEKSDWIKGRIAEVLPYRSYKIQTENNRIFRCNRRHIRFSNEDPVIFRYEDEKS